MFAFKYTVIPRFTQTTKKFAERSMKTKFVSSDQLRSLSDDSQLNVRQLAIIIGISRTCMFRDEKAELKMATAAFQSTPRNNHENMLYKEKACISRSLILVKRHVKITINPLTVVRILKTVIRKFGNIFIPLEAKVRNLIRKVLQLISPLNF